jgi:hypothetical protein
MGLLTPLAIRVGAISWMPRLLPQIAGDIPVFLLTRR